MDTLNTKGKVPPTRHFDCGCESLARADSRQARNALACL